MTSGIAKRGIERSSPGRSTYKEGDGRGYILSKEVNRQ